LIFHGITNIKDVKLIHAFHLFSPYLLEYVQSLELEVLLQSLFTQFYFANPNSQIVMMAKMKKHLLPKVD
jgi:hypothetical protein